MTHTHQNERTPILEQALRALGTKVPVASALRSEDWAQVPVALRNSAQFSAAVTSARLLGSVQERLKGQLAQQRERLASGEQAVFGRGDFIDAIRQIARDEGIDTRFNKKGDPGKGGITDIQSIPRLGLIYDTQTNLAQGYARWKLDNSEGALLLYPAAKFQRVEDRKDPRPDEFWPERWVIAGAKVNWVGALQEPMVALKTSPIWAAVSLFGNPYPPFDFNSGWGMEEIDYEETVALGLLKDGQLPEATPDKEFDDNLEASTKTMSNELEGKVVEFFKGQVKKDGDSLRWDGAPPIVRSEPIVVKPVEPVVVPEPPAPGEPVNPVVAKPTEPETVSQEVLAKAAERINGSGLSFDKQFGFLAKLPKKLEDIVRSLQVKKNPTAFVSYETKVLNLNGRPDVYHGLERTAVHEFGHVVHFDQSVVTPSYTNQDFSKAMDKDYKHALGLLAPEVKTKVPGGIDSGARSSFFARSKSGGQVSLDNAIDKLYREAVSNGELKPLSPKELALRKMNIADTLGGLSRGKIGYGHDADYYSEHNAGTAEVFANTFENLVHSKDPVYDRLFPRITKDLKDRFDL